MSPSCYITARVTPNGKKRWVVRYRLPPGGREAKLIHGGSFPTRREAQQRRDFIAGEIAAGRDPRLALLAIATTQPDRTIREWAEAWLGTRLDLEPASVRSYRSNLGRFLNAFGDHTSVSPHELQEWFATVQASPRTLSVWRTVIAMVFDYARVDPNPARGREIKLPRIKRVEHAPPAGAHVLAALDRLPPDLVLPVIVLEQTAMRSGELASLPWGDVDVIGNRFRLSATRTKTHRARWIQVPAWLTPYIVDTCALEDHTAERRVFPRAGYDRLRKALERACIAGGVPHFAPHSLRHRRLSLWHGQGIPAAELAARAGHAKSSMTLDVYSHVMPLDEVSPASFEERLRSRETPVRSRSQEGGL